MMELWMVLDKWNHTLNFPKFISKWICYKYDRSCGLTEAEAKQGECWK